MGLYVDDCLVLCVTQVGNPYFLCMGNYAILGMDNRFVRCLVVFSLVSNIPTNESNPILKLMQNGWFVA